MAIKFRRGLLMKKFLISMCLIFMLLTVIGTTASAQENIVTPNYYIQRVINTRIESWIEAPNELPYHYPNKYTYKDIRYYDYVKLSEVILTKTWSENLGDDGIRFYRQYNYYYNYK